MELILEFIKPLTISIICYLFLCAIWMKNHGYIRKILAGIVFTSIASCASVLLKTHFMIDEPYKTIIIILFFTITLSIYLKTQIESILVSLVIVYALSYVLFVFGVISSFILLVPFNLSDDIIGNSIRFLISSAVSIIAALFLLKLKTDYKQIFNKFVSGVLISISSIIIIFYALLKEDISTESQILVLCGFAALGYGIYSSFKREAIISNDINARDVAIKKHEEILAQKERDIMILQDISDYLESDVHKKDKKLDGMKRAVEKVIYKSSQMDVLDDARKILEEIEMSREKDERVYTEKILSGINLAKTGLVIVDAKIETVLEKAALKRINFNFEIHGDISDLDLFIPQFELANIIGDLTENAFTAIKHQGRGRLRKMKLIITNDNGCYELSLLDTGIPFNIETLVKLGTGRVSSHLGNGGSGCGYETIFELLYEHGASLCITEYEHGSNTFSKKISITFDNKSDYLVKSFRADEIKKQNTNPDLVITK